MNQKNVHNKNTADIPYAMLDEEAEEYEGPQYKPGNISGEEALLKSRAETKNLEPEPPANILGKWGEYSQKLFKLRPPIEYIYKELIPKGIEGGLFAGGGTGKTFFGLQQTLYGAAGLPFGRLEPTRPLHVVFLCAEDEERFLLERAENIINNDGLLRERLDLIKQNSHIKSLTDRFTPFVQFNNHGNIEETNVFKNILNELLQWKNIDLIILDPLMSFWGLPENESVNGQALIVALRKIAKTTGATVQVSHHVSKTATVESICGGGGRGTSSIYDGLRFAFGMLKVLPTVSGKAGELKANPEYTRLKFQCQDKNPSFAKMFSAKSNHAAELPGILFFRRGYKGVLEPLDVIDFYKEARTELLSFLKNSAPISKNDLLRENVCAEIRGKMKQLFDLGREKLEQMINQLISAGEVEETESQEQGPGRGKIVLIVTK